MLRHLVPSLCGVAAFLALAAPVRADDQFEEYRKRQKVAAQAIEKDLRDAVAEAKRQADAPLALKNLDAALTKLQADTTMEIAKRAELRNLIESTVKEIKNPKRFERSSLYDRLPLTAGEKDEKLKKEIDTILELQKQGKTAEAQALTGKLVAENPALVAAETTKAKVITGAVVDEAQRVQAEKAKSSTATLNEVQKSSIPASGDISYPPDYLAKMAKRKEKMDQMLGMQRTMQEKTLLRLLETRIASPIVLKGQPLQQALAVIEKELGVSLNLQKRTLDELRLDYSTPVDLNVGPNATKRNVLNAFFEQLGLTYIIKNEQITVVSKEEASKTMVTRILPVDSLVGGLVSGQTPEQLIRYIEDNVEPDSWKRNNGQGTITYFPASRVLIIRNSAAVISVLEKGL